jgi:ABC-type multidrug transport system fused ATPase/permease subunit
MTETPPQRTQSDLAIVRRLSVYLRGQGRTLAAVLVMLVLSASGQALGPTLIGRAVDQFIIVGDAAGLAQTMFQLAGVYLLGYMGFMGQIRLMGTLAQRLLLRLRGDIFGHVQKLSLGYFQSHGAGDLMSRLVNDTDAIGTLFSQSLVQSLGSLFGLVAVLIAMFAVNLQLAFVTVLILPVMIATTLYFSRLSRLAFRETRQTLGQLSADLEESLTSVRESQAFARSEFDIAHFMADNAANRDANIHAAGITAAFAPTMDVLSTLATVLVAGVGGWMVFNNAETGVTVGVVVAFLAYAQQFFRPVQQLSSLYTQMQSAFAASERVFELLDTPVEIEDKPKAIELPAVNGHVRLEEVVFGYDGSQVILNGLSLEARPGETIALVGETGAGKSTVVNLIGRFYDVNAGRVLVDGFDVRDLAKYNLRRQLGEVPQDSYLFNDTIANNIRYGRPEAGQEEVEAAAQAARAHDFIAALPDGYETELSSAGSSLSQGQRQLLCIARAFLADPRVLILDEATANIDTRTERLVQAAIDTLLDGRTAFVIAHRLSTIRHADKIVVMADQGISEQGTHDELLAADGIYAALIRTQQSR